MRSTQEDNLLIVRLSFCQFTKQGHRARATGRNTRPGGHRHQCTPKRWPSVFWQKLFRNTGSKRYLSNPFRPFAAGKPEAKEDPQRPQIVTNPVCGMPISLGMAKYIVEQNGAPIYFCCDGCKIKFDAEPEKYSKQLNL